MELQSPRGRVRRDSAAELVAHCLERFEAGARVADAEFGALSDLAEAIRVSVLDWRSLASRLELSDRLDARRAVALVLETVFDELMAPAAWRVLADLLAAAEL